MLIIQRPTVEAIGEEDANRQSFAIGPLDRGFGHTIGNALRRTLLSSIPGAAVTEVRFDEALHEFTFLPGVKEDISDIILNLKDLVLRLDGDDPVTLRVDVHGPVELTGAAISLPAGVEMLTPELHLATVNQKGHLAMELTVERGKGYLPAEQHHPGMAIGVIPIDAIFSPVRRVTFRIEPTRVEQATDFDRLVLDVETDGSISPRDALASAGQTLRSLVALVAEMSDRGYGLELGDLGVSTSGSPDLDLPIEDLDLPIEDLDLSERPRNCLKRAQINTIGQLVQRDPEELLGITNFGQKSLDEVLVRLDERGLSLKGLGEL